MAKRSTKKPKRATRTTYTYPVIEIVQGTVRMYAFVAPSEVLRKVCAVSRREDDAGKGYRRHLKESRLRQVARYLDENEGVIPNNIILDFYLHFPRIL